MAGGSIFDDFNGDGLLDVFTTPLDADREVPPLFINRGDGTFEDRSLKAGLGASDRGAELQPSRLRQRRRSRRPPDARRLGECHAAPRCCETKGTGPSTDVTVASGARRCRSPRSRPPGATTTTTAISTCSSAASICPIRTPAPPAAPPSRSRSAQLLPALPQQRRRHLHRRRGGGRRPQRALGQGIGLGRLRRRRPARPLRLEHRPGRIDSTTTTATAPSPTSPRARSDRADRTALPAGSSTTTTTAGSTSSSTASTATLAEVIRSHLGQPADGERPTALPQRGHRRLPRRHAARPGSTGSVPGHGLQLRRHRQRRLSRHLPGHRPAGLLLRVPNVMFKNVEGRRFEDVTDLDRHRPPAEGTRDLVRRLRPRRRRRHLPRRPAARPRRPGP